MAAIAAFALGTGYLMWREAQRSDPSTQEAAANVSKSFHETNLHHGLPKPVTKEFAEMLSVHQKGQRKELDDTNNLHTNDFKASGQPGLKDPPDARSKELDYNASLAKGAAPKPLAMLHMDNTR